ncbi:MAG: glycosyltransferase [Thermoguttaceae bacterium]|nr:glycosyltransferase [Thermoguttaceae bacterium]
MPIVHLIPNLSPSGDSAQLRALVRIAKTGKMEVPREGEMHIFSFSPVDEDVRKELESENSRFMVRVHELRARFAQEVYWKVFWKIRELRLRPRAVHVWGEFLMRAGLHLAKRFHARSIASLRHADPWFFAEDPGLFARFDVLTANSNGVKNAWEKRGIRGNWNLLPDFLDADLQNTLTPSVLNGGETFKTAETSETASGSKTASALREELLADLGIPSDAVLAACVGPVAPWKRWQWAVWSIDSIVRVCPQMHLLFFDPELEDRRARSLSPQTERERRSIAKFTLQYERESIVHFLPFRQDLQQLLPALNYFWAPHSISGAGLAMLEAARAGVPVIASETESLGELFPQGACASVPTHHETTAIAAATYLLETHSDRRAEQIAAAHSALKKFSDAARFADAYFNLYAQDLS